jgi:hypothetical protein
MGWMYEQQSEYRVNGGGLTSRIWGVSVMYVCAFITSHKVVSGIEPVNGNEGPVLVMARMSNQQATRPNPARAVGGGCQICM